MTRLSRFLLLTLWAAIVPFFILWPAYAQAPCGDAGDYYLENNWSVLSNTSGITWSANGDNWNVDCSSCGYTDPDYATLAADYGYRVHTGDVLYLYFNKNTSNNAMEVRGRILLSSGDVITGTWKDDASFPSYVTVTVPEDYDGFLVDQIFIDVSTFRGPAFGESYTFYPASSYFTLSCPDIGGGAACALIQNADFYTSDGWFLSNEAVITDGVATVPQTGIVAQNLTLESYTTYNAIISTTNTVTTPGQLAVTLGGDTVLLDIEEPGVYTATFTTPNLGGVIIYGFTTITELPIAVDYTCVSLAPGSSGESGCLAPTNGTFENESGWNWYRGAEWFYPDKSASLPVADVAMIATTSTYTLPALAADQHLLLGFTARGLNDGGVIAGQVTNGGSTAEFNFSTYRAVYTYEVSLDTLAEETGVQLSFANPGDVITGVVSTADVLLDNVCIFTANRGPNLPAPTDPGGITPIDPGLQGFTSCASLDGIWAGFGVNMAQYRADYAAGTSVWDPLGWVPWLISAIFVTLGDWACFFFAAFLNLMDLITYFLNSVMNIGNWFVRIWPLFIAWLSLWNNWLAGSLANIANAIGNTLAAWSNWIGDALWATSEAIKLTIQAAMEWIGNSLASLSASIAAFLSGWADWIGTSLANLSNWLGATLAALWDWLAAYFFSLNGLRFVINWLIAAWNNFITSLGTVLSFILETLMGIWNDSLWPFLSDVWAWVSGMTLTVAALLIDFIVSAWGLLKSMFLWLWENVISVAHTPLTFYYAFDNGINSDPYNLVSCSGTNFWCTFLAGVQLINQILAHSTFYPIVIVGIILSTLYILWDNFKELFSPIEIR